MNPPALVLASNSPRRLELLRQIGLEPRIVAPKAEERLRDGEAPRDAVVRLARDKVRSVLSTPGLGERAVILGADTAVVIDGQVLGKPRDDEDAVAMLTRLSGRTHHVLTGVWLVRTDTGAESGGAVETRVTFRDYDATTARHYAGGGEPRDKAGAYAIQGRGALLIEGIEGSWSNVVGLPVERLASWLDDLGLDITTWVRWDTD